MASVVRELKDEEFNPLTKFIKALVLLKEVEAQLSVIEDQITLTAISELALESSKVFFDMFLSTQRKIERILKLTQNGFYKKS